MIPDGEANHAQKHEETIQQIGIKSTPSAYTNIKLRRTKPQQCTCKASTATPETKREKFISSIEFYFCLQ